MLFSQDIISVLQKTITNEGSISLPSEGNSMYSLIQQGDICRFAPFDPTSLKKGDILLFWASNGKLIAHRFYKMESENTYSCKGDTNFGFDEPIQKERILGTLVSIEKQRYVVQPSNLIVAGWSKLILTFPFLSFILRSYLNRRF
ncbi:hypothetical protein ACFFHF_12320 [Robertmurraya beringensis]|uniref:Signal peptidase I n=1 Tax=Robertmurraya beringensis TaxID=641660 RepID=A0ABV6KRR4_9BACI